MKELHATQYSQLLRRTDITGPLKNESSNLVMVDGIECCTFLIAEKLGWPFVTILTSTFGVTNFGAAWVCALGASIPLLPYRSHGFRGRVKKSLKCLISALRGWYINAQFDSTIREHFPEGSRPVSFHLSLKTELWFVNSDFAFDFSCTPPSPRCPS